MKMQNKATAFKRGGWIALVCAALLIVVILSSTLFDLLGTSSRIDMTASGAFTLSDPTLALLNGLTSEIGIYAVLQDGAPDTRLTELLLRYADASDKISAHLITGDQAAYFTTAQLDNNSLIVTCGSNISVIEYADLYELEYEVSDYYQTLTDYRIAAEDRINKAIDRVTSDLPIAYLLANHGEAAPESGLIEKIGDAGCHTANLYLGELNAVPEDAAMVICNAPQADLTEKEADLLIAYLDNGGNFLLITEMQYGVGEQLSRVTQHAGLTVNGGIVMEGDSNYMFGADYAYYLLPEFAPEHPIAKEMTQGEESAERVLIGLAHAISLAEGSEYEPAALLKTSASAYLKPNAYLDGVVEYVEGDETGPFIIAATSEKQGGGKFFWLAGSQCLSDGIDEIVAGANYGAAGRILGWMHENTVVSTLEEVPAKSIISPTISMEQPALFIGVALALPVLLFALGMILCAKRHKASISSKAE